MPGSLGRVSGPRRVGEGKEKMCLDQGLKRGQGNRNSSLLSYKAQNGWVLALATSRNREEQVAWWITYTVGRSPTTEEHSVWAKTQTQLYVIVAKLLR